MKKIIQIALSLASFFSFGQTATNFNCNDCASVNHDLFSELNSGKVVVIVWVMPCANCISGALAAQSACNSFASSNPGQVYFYVADDNGNTPCSTILSWCASNGVTNTNAKFSQSAVSMANYGAAGMPKVVVLGGSNHTVFYNDNNSAITTAAIQSAISTALSAISAGVKEFENSVFTSASIYPNPSNSNSILRFSLSIDSKVKVQVFDQLGQNVGEMFNGSLLKGENTININTSSLSNGNYFVTISDGNVTRKVKLVVVR